MSRGTFKMHSSSPVLIEGHIQLIVAERVLGDTFVRFVERSRRKHSRFVEISHGEHSQFVARCQFEIPGVEPMFCWIGGSRARRTAPSSAERTLGGTQGPLSGSRRRVLLRPGCLGREGWHHPVLRGPWGGPRVLLSAVHGAVYC